MRLPNAMDGVPQMFNNQELQPRYTAHLVVKVDIANVCSSPKTRGRLLGKVEYGELLRTFERRSQWVRIHLESVT